MPGAVWVSWLLAAAAAASEPRDTAVATQPADASVARFRTEVAPRMNPVFGDALALRRNTDRFLLLQAEMEQTRAAFSTAVHATLAALAGRPPGARDCPVRAMAEYAAALGAGERFLALGRDLLARFRDLRRADELGDTAGLTPDYRLKVRRAREFYLGVLRDYREMRAAFHQQLGAEMRAAGCRTPSLAQLRGGPPVGAPGPEGAMSNDPSDANAWEVEPPPGVETGSAGSAGSGVAAAPPGSPRAAAAEGSTAAPAGRRARATGAPAAAPAIWIHVDNSHCRESSEIAMDGASLGQVAASKKAILRARAGPHEVCVLPRSDPRACGDPGTLRRAYLHDGWTLVVRCER